MAGWIAGVGAGGALLSGALNLKGQSDANANAGNALQVAMQNYMLQKKMADQQYELSTAGSTDARGNKTTYVPGVGWTTTPTAQTRDLIQQSDAIQGMRGQRELTTGASDYSRNFNRRLSEGSAANPMLDAMRYKYGAPNRDAVVGADKIAGVTSAGEAGDAARSGFASSALRTGTGVVPLGRTMAGIDSGTTQGIRSSLARSDANANPLYEGMLANFNKTRLDPYNMLATRASNPEGSGFQPENISSGLDASLQQKGYVGAATNGRQGTALAASTNPMIAAMMAYKPVNYDSMSNGITANLQALLRSMKSGSGGTAPVGAGGRPMYGGGFDGSE